MNYGKQTINRQLTPSRQRGFGATLLGILRGLFVTLMIFGLFFAGVGMAVYATSMRRPLLDELLLPNEDMPAGYAMNSDLSGELTAERAGRLGISGWAEVADIPAIILTLTRRSDELVAFTANTRTEWSYSAAIAAATTLPRSGLSDGKAAHDDSRDQVWTGEA